MSARRLTLPDEARALFGVATDTEIARRYGCAQATVSAYRRAAGIQPAPRRVVAGGRPRLPRDEEGRKVGGVADLRAAVRAAIEAGRPTTTGILIPFDAIARLGAALDASTPVLEAAGLNSHPEISR